MCNKASDVRTSLVLDIRCIEAKADLCFHMCTHIYVLMQLFRVLLDLLATRRLSDRQKDLEILLLRHQLQILGAQTPQLSGTPRSRNERRAFSQSSLSN